MATSSNNSGRYTAVSMYTDENGEVHMVPKSASYPDGSATPVSITTDANGEVHMTPRAEGNATPVTMTTDANGNVTVVPRAESGTLGSAVSQTRYADGSTVEFETYTNPRTGETVGTVRRIDTEPHAIDENYHGVYGVTNPTPLDERMHYLYGVNEPTPAPSTPANPATPSEGTALGLTRSKIEENIATLDSAAKTMQTSWDSSVKNSLTTIQSSWAGPDCEAYVKKVQAMDTKMQNSIQSIKLLSDTYRQALQMIDERTQTVMNVINN